MIRVPTRCLREGSIIATDVYDGNFGVLVKKNSKVDKKIIDALKKFKIISVYILDEYSSDDVEDIISPELRLKATMNLKNMAYNFKNIEGNNTKEDYVGKIKIIVNEIVDEILEKKRFLIEQIDIRSYENYNFSHSINVTIMAVVLGVKLNYDRRNLERIGLAAILHDIGKVFVPKDIFLKNIFFENELNKEEEKLLHYHCEAGYNYLTKFNKIDEEIRMAVLNHHELIDGSGYPNGLKGNKISVFGRIISVVDFYDRIMSSEYLLNKSIPGEILEEIMVYSNSVFDFNIVKNFFGIVKPFLEGTLVMLNNNDIAKVIGTRKGMPLRPIVEVIRSSSKDRMGKYVDLSKKLDLTIVKVVYYLD